MENVNNKNNDTAVYVDNSCETEDETEASDECVLEMSRKILQQNKEAYKVLAK